MKDPKTFLLIDDDADDVALFQETLQEVSPVTLFRSAHDGHEALEMLAKESQLPDLIFLDLNMPRMSGQECLNKMKSDLRFQKIPVIMYTTSSHSRDIEETILSGAICFITKPSSVRELRTILHSITSSLPNQLEKTLQSLSKTTNTFIVC